VTVTAVASVLVVDDDPTVSDVVRRYLEHAGYQVTLAADGEAAVSEHARVMPDLVILDLMLPGLDGLEVCRRIRQKSGRVPIIMLTALGEEMDRITGLQLGADDYVTKPFSPGSWCCGPQSVLRRAQPPAHSPAGETGPIHDLIRDGDLEVDPVKRIARWRGEELPLTVREFDLLVYLMSHPGVALKRADLLNEVWGWTFGDQSTVTVHVRRLREKIEEDPANPKRIQTVWGVGYRYGS